MERMPEEDTGRVVAIAASILVLLVAGGWIEGVFSRLDRATVAALVLFAFGFAVATWRLDPQVRRWAGSLRGRVTKSPAASPGARRSAT